MRTQLKAAALIGALLGTAAALCAPSSSTAQDYSAMPRSGLGGPIAPSAVPTAPPPAATARRPSATTYVVTPDVVVPKTDGPQPHDVPVVSAETMKRLRKQVPKYDHIVIVMMENQNYGSIIGPKTDAPYINQLAKKGTLLTNYMAVAHPSEGNYLAIYAGSDFGITDKTASYKTTGPSMYQILKDAKKSFAAYVELEKASSSHHPWEDFPEDKTVQRDFKTLPKGDYKSLPHVSFVIPNVMNDMHDGTVAQGDAWLKKHLSGYADWAVKNNSLLIVQWDENAGDVPNRVPSVFYGARLRGGPDNTLVNHYSLLSTILASHGLAGPKNAEFAAPIDIFRPKTTRTADRIASAVKPGKKRI
jgi:hypothetical protein